MTLTFELSLDIVQLHPHTKFRVYALSSLPVRPRTDGHKHGNMDRPRPLTWDVKNNDMRFFLMHADSGSGTYIGVGVAVGILVLIVILVGVFVFLRR